MRRILVVDDDALIGQAGYRVSTAGSRAEGLALLERSAFDLLVVDVFMPNMRGFEPIRVFHERAPRTPLIAISGGAFGDPEPTNPDFLRMAARLGATRCLCTPFKPLNSARRDRRLPVGSRAASKIRHRLGCAVRTARRRRRYT